MIKGRPRATAQIAEVVIITPASSTHSPHLPALSPLRLGSSFADRLSSSWPCCCSPSRKKEDSEIRRDIEENERACFQEDDAAARLVGPLSAKLGSGLMLIIRALIPKDASTSKARKALACMIS